MILYADIYILINFVCDFISLFLCASVTSSRIGYARIALSAFAMAVYSFFAFVSDINCFLRIPLDFFILLCGIRAALGKMKLSFLVRSSLVFLASCIVTGGIAGLLSGVTTLRAVITFFVTPIIYFAWYLSVKVMKHSEKLVSITIDGQRLCGLSDSGNMLYDREKGLHIIVANAEKLRVGEELFAGWIKTETVCGTGYMPYYYPESVEVGHRKVRAAVALNCNKNLKYDCIVPRELT